MDEAEKFMAELQEADEKARLCFLTLSPLFRACPAIFKYATPSAGQ